ncbi:hypothetical protein M406DRAFT_295495 [Cryphonectria parasitica EP155]|uniref:HECT-type E3 ubiquitin transferase n=1 Tax=Cryphonectria parasitica (strain ATCC 38755 / EP155) TaxID=660469 RepID=A0A9P5CLG1_CRYP1|nr:uncharacterized protein M406DRAFT_295495 [Cryphonectria parasitica EP155]KAF3761795.1 hypothetical protein M406DRAFT_295495 [Cryphonectria parasitica EP155]
MSFPTFSGNSRRPRNVNMSGQRNLNPFAATTWTPSSSSNASKTVADAQAERRQRQQERAKIRAVESIQRTWRGHRVRRNLRDEQRQWLDKLYEGNSFSDPATRSSQALSAVVTSLDPSRSEDQARLERFATDLADSGCSALAAARPSQIRRLTSQLLALLRRYLYTYGFGPQIQGLNRLPPFIEKAIGSLVERDEISNILEKFTANFAGSSLEEHNQGSLLAAYILTLIRCFPALGDDIRMKLYMASVPLESGHSNSVKFFWEAMVETNIFTLIRSDEQGDTLALLKRQNSKQSSVVRDDSLWDREWRAILLFLELYVFVLRLTDDEDFAYPWTSAGFHTGSTSRLRQCMLTLTELKGLSLFLRNLAFTLYYNENELQEHGERLMQFATSNTTVDELFSPSAQDTPQKRKTQGAYNVISGVDFDTFRSTITTAMRMVYERDSRRQFLPREHWLMTSRFDMQNFMDNVVMEVERQRQLRKEGLDGDEVDMDEDEDEDEDNQDSFGRLPTGYTSQALRIERLREAHKKEQRKRLLAAVGPKLEILRNMPFIIPFDVRVKVFRKLVIVDKTRRRNGMLEADQWRMQVLHEFLDPHRARDRLERHHAKVRRGKVFEDAFAQFYQLQDGLKEPIQITFVDQFDIPEAGIDGGGVTKEFLTSVTKEAFTDDFSLFIANSKSALYPNPCALDQRQEKLREAGIKPDSEAWREDVLDILAQYEFLGRIIGKCLYEGILIDVVFAGFFLLKWAAAASDASYRANINDLREFDEELYNGMMRLKNYPGDVSELGLDFTIEDQVSLPNEPMRIATRQLLPNGDQIAVTNENKLLYINYVVRHRLVAQPFAVTRAFLTGLGTIIEPAWLSMFNQSELQRLVGGDSTDIDIEDLRRNTVYSGLYDPGDEGLEHPTIQMFWEVMQSLEDSQRRDVLKYVTSTPRAPLLGFSQLSPRFSIRDGGRDTTRLPSASTCVNLLKLPTYDSAQLLREKLLYAVSSGAGFDLS